MNKNSNLSYVFIALFVMAGLVAIIFFIMQGITYASGQKTERIQSCVENGGTWLNQYSMCIAPDKEAR